LSSDWKKVIHWNGWFHNKTTLNVPKITEIGSGIFKMLAEDMSLQMWWPDFVAYPLNGSSCS